MLEATHLRIGSAVTVRTLATEILVLLARVPVDGVGNESARRVATVVREVEETFYDEWNPGRAALRAGEHSVLGVMFSCGFNDVTHFYRLFRARHGAPPRAWQARTDGKK